MYYDSETKHLICFLVLGSLKRLFFAEMNDNENVMRCFPVPLSVGEANICCIKLTFGPEIDLDFSHSFLGAFSDAFATLDAESVVYDRVSL